jgi:uncharacterized protein YdeI (YjbR/CyaY-like superfamily)
MSRDPRIDAYIAKAAPFAQPILAHVRALVHRVLPGVEEGIKWGMPAFMIGGKNVAGMAAFKAHCAVMIHGEGRLGAEESRGEGMGGYGKVATLADLPDDAVLETALKEAAQRVASSGTARKLGEKKPPKEEIAVPQDFAAELAANPAAGRFFDGLAPSHRREYLEWITEAKRDETRGKRIATALEWLAEGKRRNWKYEKR